MELRLDLLLLLDAHGPQAFDAVGGFGCGRVAVPFVRVDFRDAQGEEGEWEELEGFGGGGGGGYWGEGGVFGACFGVGGGLEGAESTFDWWGGGRVSGCGLGKEGGGEGDGRREVGGWRTFDHVFALPVEDARSALQVLAAQPFGDGDGFGVRGAGVDGDLLARGRGTALLLRGGGGRGLLLDELLVLPLVGFEGLLFEAVDVLFECHAGFFGVGFELLPLPELELLRRHAALLRFDGHLLLHGCDLLWRGLLPWGGWGVHCGSA